MHRFTQHHSPVVSRQSLVSYYWQLATSDERLQQEVVHA